MYLLATVSQLTDSNRGKEKHVLYFSFLKDFFQKSFCFSQTSLFAAVSQLSDLNRLPARYEGAALPGELSWQNIKLWINLDVELIFGQRSVLNP